MATEIIFGPPGTGKTTACVALVEGELRRGTRPEDVGYVSFTRRAAAEAVERASKHLSLGGDQLRHFRTLHSTCYRALGLKDGDVFEGKVVAEFERQIGVRVSHSWSEDGTTFGFETGDRVMHMHNLARVRMIPLRQQYEEDSDDLPWSEVDRISRAYEEFKREEKVIDYTDMLKLFADGDGACPALHVVVVDEAQDQSNLQWRVVRRLAARARRKVAAGDDDQAIFVWAGANAEKMLDIDGAVRVLGQSWRVPARIQDVAESIIRGVTRRQSKSWKPREGDAGEVDRVHHFADADVSGPDVLVLARNTYVIREQVVPVLRAAGVIYEYRGNVSVSERVRLGVRAWEQLRRGASVSVQEARAVYSFLESGVDVARGHKTLPGFPDDATVTFADLRQSGGLLASGEAIWHQALTRLPPDEREYLLTALRRGERPTTGRPRVRVSTIHGAKGGEAEQVILFAEMAPRTYREMRERPDDERRVWYVAATRAKQKLTVVDSSRQEACPWI